MFAFWSTAQRGKGEYREGEQRREQNGFSTHTHTHTLTHTHTHRARTRCERGQVVQTTELKCQVSHRFAHIHCSGLNTDFTS